MPQEHYQRVHAFSTIPVIHPALFFDDCSGTMNWLSFGTGADWTAEYDPVAAYVQTNGLLLKTRATDPAAADFLNCYRRLWLPPLGILRLQAMFSQLTDAPDQTLEFIIFWYVAPDSFIAGLRFYASTGVISRGTDYVAGEVIWTPIPDWSLPIGDGIWNKLDISFNPKTKLWHRIQVNEHVLDASALPLVKGVSGLAKFIYFLIRMENVAPVQVTAYVDQILLTQEAP